MHATPPLLANSDFPPIRRAGLDTLQVNLGYKCNQSCLHCHVNAGPQRTEQMSAETIDSVLRFLDSGEVETLDITGGAPELHPQFRELVAAARERQLDINDRCNLTLLLEPGQQSFTVLGEAYMEVRLTDWSNARAGRTAINLPYLNRNDSRMVPNTFEAYTLIKKTAKQLGLHRLAGQADEAARTR